MHEQERLDALVAVFLREHVYPDVVSVESALEDVLTTTTATPVRPLLIVKSSPDQDSVSTTLGFNEIAANPGAFSFDTKWSRGEAHNLNAGVSLARPVSATCALAPPPIVIDREFMVKLEQNVPRPFSLVGPLEGDRDDIQESTYPPPNRSQTSILMHVQREAPAAKREPSCSSPPPSSSKRPRMTVDQSPAPPPPSQSTLERFLSRVPYRPDTLHTSRDLLYCRVTVSTARLAEEFRQWAANDDDDDEEENANTDDRTSSMRVLGKYGARMTLLQDGNDVMAFDFLG